MAEKITLTGNEGFHIHPPVNSTTNGFMSKTDKIMLDASTAEDTPGTLVKRDSNGQAKVSEPTDPEHIARKQDVDNLIITTPKIAEEAVTSPKIADEAIEARHISGGLTLIGDALGINAKFNLIDEQLADIAINIRHLGAIADDPSAAAKNINTTIINQALSDCRLNRHSLFIPGKFHVNATVVLASPELDFVPIFGTSKEDSALIFNGDAPIISCAGTSDNYVSCGLIEKLNLTNLNTGTNARAIECSYTGTLNLNEINIKAQNDGITGIECISPTFQDVYIYGSDIRLQSGIKGLFRNLKWIGGRIYGATYSINIGGDYALFEGLNVEFSKVICKQNGAIAGILFNGCHFETSDLLFTNAVTVPLPNTLNNEGVWADNSSQGTGITGKVEFKSCIIRTINQNTNFVVIKSQPSFVYNLKFDGCSLDDGANFIIAGTFLYDGSTNVPSGITIEVVGQTAPTIKIQKDIYTKYIVPSNSGYEFSRINNVDFDKFAILEPAGRGYVGNNGVAMSFSSSNDRGLVRDDPNLADPNIVIGEKQSIKVRQTSTGLMPFAFETSTTRPSIYAQGLGGFDFDTTRGLLAYDTNPGNWEGWFSVPSRRVDSVPTTGTYQRGDIILVRLPDAGGYAFFVCTTAGTPGVWKQAGTISA
ncbi:hypothetical protein PaeBR_18700 [Paenibacillus sp. BR2-3]|uniref:hypothetical protein n=1 Tax=Paenibacillus sp. BR2-3 TaxID=3048494 RepID=UPI003977A7E1